MRDGKEAYSCTPQVAGLKFDAEIGWIGRSRTGTGYSTDVAAMVA